MARIVLNRAAVAASARVRGREVVRPLAAQVLQGARLLVRRGNHRHGSGARQAGPTLRTSLKSQQVRTKITEIVYDIGSTNRYAMSEHQGSRPHTYYSRGKLMKFRSERARFAPGRRPLKKQPFIFASRVRHPGNKRPQRFLTIPLNQFGRAAGFRVSTRSTGIGFLP